LKPTSICLCIYGQMTGNCNNERSIELFSKTCSLFTEDCKYEWSDSITVTTIYNIDDRKQYYFSMVESYIILEGANNEDVIKYLKGEIEDIKL